MGKSLYQYPLYHWIAYSYNREKECDFFEACFKRHASFHLRDILDIACGSGGHMFELNRRGYKVTGFDISPEMVQFIKDKAREEGLGVKAFVSDMRSFDAGGIYDCAICATDTFRFLLSDDEATSHLRCVANSLKIGGLYILDFWAPQNDGDFPNFDVEWEAQQGSLRVKAIYRQYPDTFDPKAKLFEDELGLEVDDNGKPIAAQSARMQSRYLTRSHFNRLIRDEASFKVKEEICEGWRFTAILKKQ